MDARAGGTSSCTFQLFQALHQLDGEARLLTVAPAVTGAEVLGEGTPWLINLPNDYCTPFSISRNFRRWLKDSDAEVYHTNGLWMDVNHATCAIARSKRKPYVITPHGMLYREALRRSRWKKLPLEWMCFRHDIMNASCIHVTCQQEMEEVRLYGYRGPVAVIGNPVEVPEYTGEIIANRHRDNDSLWSLAFLGRLHPIKRIENLLYGVALTKREDIEVYIIGKGNESYEQFLHTEVQRLGIESKVHFPGFLSGYEKFVHLGQTDCLFVPSDMENFGMIVPEALIVGTPVMASLGTPWKVLNEERCGWWIDNSPESIARVIDDLISKTPEERIAMGQRGRDYILRTFTADKVASRMLALYQWLIGSGDKPEFVFTL